MLASYIGFEEEETEWVPLKSMYKYVPDMVRDALEQFLKKGISKKKQLAQMFLNHIKNLPKS